MQQYQTVGFLHYEAVGAFRPFSILKKATLFAPRNAFLLLVKLNAFNLAVRLYKAMKKNEKGLKKKWEGLGGSYNALKKVVMKRINTRIKKGKSVGQVAGFDHAEIGVVPLAAALALAVPILKALAGFIGKNKNAGAETPEE